MWNLAVLLTTVGRPCLRRMLLSLLTELSDNDHLYIAIDGPNAKLSAMPIIAEFTGKWKCQVVIFQHPIQVKFWGHELRNTYQSRLEGDYILHADDDDIYEPGAFNLIREQIKEKGQLYIFQMSRPYHQTKIIPARDEIAQGNMGSPCGIVANSPHLFGQWENDYDGDFKFWKRTAELFGSHRIHFTHVTIYRVLGADHFP
jgi:hypothetical protein